MIRVFTAANKGIVSKVLISRIQSLSESSIVVHSITGGLPILSKGDICLVCGNKALIYLQELGVVSKNRKIEGLRGQVISAPDGRGSYLITYDPFITTIDAGKGGQINWDVELACRWHDYGTTEAKIGDYRYVEDLSEAIEYINTKYETTQSPVLVSIDTETLGLVPQAPGCFIVMLIVCFAPGVSHCIRFRGYKDQPILRMKDGSHKIQNDLVAKQVRFLLSSAKKVKVRGANFKYDMQWFTYHWGITNYNSFAMDTTVVGSLIDENRSNSLNSHTKTYVPELGGYDDAFNAKYDKSRMDLVPDIPLLTYGGGDGDACYKVSIHLRRELIKDKRLTKFYTRLVHPAIKAVSKMEARGTCVNMKVYDEIHKEVSAERERVHEEIINMLPRAIRRKYSTDLRVTRDCIVRDMLFSKEGMNLKPLMFTEKTKAPSASMEHYEAVAAKHKELEPFVKLMADFNSAEKTLSTYIVGFKKHIRSDGKFHPSYMLFRGEYGDKGGDAGTVSGRTSAKDPAFQTIPKHTKWAKTLRKVYNCPEGYGSLFWDFSQGELRIAACIADETTMIKAYKSNIDLHSVTAALLCDLRWGMTFKEFMEQDEDWRDEMRFGGKAGNFGLLYTMGYLGFIDYARTTYGVTLTDEEAKGFKAAFFRKYPKLGDWHTHCKKVSHSTGQITSPLGRVRHLPLINSSDRSVAAKQERQCINFGPQSVLSDLGLLTLGELDVQYPELWVWGFTHDMIASYVPLDEIDVWATRVKEVMENLPLHELGWTPQLKFLVDVECSTTNWAEAKKYKI